VRQGTIDVPNQAPDLAAQQTRDIAGNAARVGWSFAIGSLLGLASAMIGAAVGLRRPRTATAINTYNE
jgi:hypothetical protein